LIKKEKKVVKFKKCCLLFITTEKSVSEKEKPNFYDKTYDDQRKRKVEKMGNILDPTGNY
jgi:hypothetical protein